MSKPRALSAIPHMSLPNHQRGASVAGVVFVIISLGLFLKLGVAIIPAQIGDYQFTKAVAYELKKSNDNKESAGKFMENLRRQLKLNADYNANPEEMITLINERAGSLAVHKDYKVVNSFFSNVNIVNHFEGDITSADAAE